MYSAMMHYPAITSTFNFTQVPLKKKLTQRVAITGMINDFKETKPLLCLGQRQCELHPRQLLRLTDLNGTKGLPSLQELFDLRPCYWKHFRNLWHYNDCFHHHTVANLFNEHQDEVLHDIDHRGKNLKNPKLKIRICQSYWIPNAYSTRCNQ